MELGIFILALAPPFLYALTNHFDHILLSKYFKEGGVGTLMLFSALLAFLALPVLYLIDNGVMQVAWENRLWLAGVGVINTILLWAYLKAIFNDEPTVVITYYQLVPILALVLANVVLGETITQVQMLAMGIIILGAVILTFALDEDGKVTWRLKTAGYMLIACFCWAAESTFFKVVALEENPTRSFFWEHVSLVVIGMLMYTFVSHYRESFKRALRFNGRAVLGLNVANEALYMAGNYVAALVVVMIPVSLTLLMNSFQPLFVLVIGLLLALFFPKLDVEHVNNRNMTQKIIAILLTGIGAFILGGW